MCHRELWYGLMTHIMTPYNIHPSAIHHPCCIIFTHLSSETSPLPLLPKEGPLITDAPSLPTTISPPGLLPNATTQIHTASSVPIRLYPVTVHTTGGWLRLHVCLFFFFFCVWQLFVNSCLSLLLWFCAVHLSTLYTLFIFCSLA